VIDNSVVGEPSTGGESRQTSVAGGRHSVISHIVLVNPVGCKLTVGELSEFRPPRQKRSHYTRYDTLDTLDEIHLSTKLAVFIETLGNGSPSQNLRTKLNFPFPYEKPGLFLQGLLGHVVLLLHSRHAG
jgi:hypothetical protein